MLSPCSRSLVYCVDDGRNDQKAGNVNVRAAPRDVERAADRPEDDDERAGRQKRRENTGYDVDGRFGCEAGVFADAIFRVVVVALDEVQMVVASLGQPVIEQMVRHPFAPQALHGHLSINIDDCDEDAGREQRKVDHGLEEGFCGVLLLERIEQLPVPDIDPILHVELHKDDDQQRAREDPGSVVAVPAPESAAHSPEASQEPLPPTDIRLGLRFVGVSSAVRL
jgi:hypothetical protein